MKTINSLNKKQHKGRIISLQEVETESNCIE